MSTGWVRLQEGNARFVAGKSTARVGADRRAELVGGQAPFALVLGCSDSRVSTEAVFDQGLGEIFVVRTAGQVLDRAVLGSVEYAVAVLGVSTLVVLGHSACGAVAAAVAVRDGAEPPAGQIGFVAGRIAEQLPPDGDPVAANASNVLRDLLGNSSVVREAEFHGTLEVLAATYDLAAGAVRAVPARVPTPVEKPAFAALF